MARVCSPSLVRRMLARGLSWLSVLAWCLPALAQTASTYVPSPVVESGKRLFLLGLMGEARVLEGNGYCYDAAVALNTVMLEGEPEEVYYKNAELLLPENLLRVGLPYSAFVLFQRIVDAGPAHPYFAAVLPRLVELHRQLPALDAVREAMAR